MEKKKKKTHHNDGNLKAVFMADWCSQEMKRSSGGERVRLLVHSSILFICLFVANFFIIFFFTGLGSQ